MMQEIWSQNITNTNRQNSSAINIAIPVIIYVWNSAKRAQFKVMQFDIFLPTMNKAWELPKNT